MKDLRNYREAHHVIAWGCCMNPKRLHAQAFRPAPARRVTWWRKVLRALVREL